jgi:hypothetical protein
MKDPPPLLKAQVEQKFSKHLEILLLSKVLKPKVTEFWRNVHPAIRCKQFSKNFLMPKNQHQTVLLVP